MELKKSRPTDSKGTKNLQVAEDGSYTIRTTEINENGDEVEVVRTVSAEECAASQGGVVQLLTAGQMQVVQSQ
jgi:hypothetical protein